jgi:hypothetical protein
MATPIRILPNGMSQETYDFRSGATRKVLCQFRGQRLTIETMAKIKDKLSPLLDEWAAEDSVVLKMAHRAAGFYWTRDPAMKRGEPQVREWIEGFGWATTGGWEATLHVEVLSDRLVEPE